MVMVLIVITRGKMVMVLNVITRCKMVMVLNVITRSKMVSVFSIDLKLLFGVMEKCMCAITKSLLCP